MAQQEMFYQLRRDGPVDWTPKEILVVKLSFAVVDGRLQFMLSPAAVHQVAMTTPIAPPLIGGPIQEFVRALVSTTPPTPTGDPREPDNNRWRWLGIPVRKASIVIVMLEGLTKWQFRASGPAITAKSDPRADTFGPWHFKANGDELPDSAPGDECKIVAFAVVRRGKFEVQSFNFHLDLLQVEGASPRWLEIMIDPDVPETGTEGFPVRDPDEPSPPDPTASVE